MIIYKQTKKVARMKKQQNIPNIAIEAFLTTVKWSLMAILGIIIVFSSLLWNLHNQTYDTKSQTVDIVQDGYGTNNNISKNEF